MDRQREGKRDSDGGKDKGRSDLTLCSPLSPHVLVLGKVNKHSQVHHQCQFSLKEEKYNTGEQETQELGRFAHFKEEKHAVNLASSPQNTNYKALGDCTIIKRREQLANVGFN